MINFLLIFKCYFVYVLVFEVYNLMYFIDIGVCICVGFVSFCDVMCEKYYIIVIILFMCEYFFYGWGWEKFG